MFDKGGTLKYIADEYQVSYVRFKKQAIVSARDFVSVGSVKDQENGVVSFSQVSLKKYRYPIAKKTVRANIAIAGTILTPKGPNKTLMV